MRKITTTACLLTLSACSAPSHLPLADGSLDGTYAGHRTIDSTCGTQSQDIVFTVLGSAITTHSHKRKHRLEGTVAANGQIALHDIGDSRLIQGQISNAMLTATETDEPSTKKKHKALDVFDPQGAACVWHYDAVRVPNG
jgi:hypothetical protein